MQQVLLFLVIVLLYSCSCQLLSCSLQNTLDGAHVGAASLLYNSTGKISHVQVHLSGGTNISRALITTRQVNQTVLFSAQGRYVEK
jgi:hypothetical protein